MDVFLVEIAVISHVCCKNILSVYVDVPSTDVHPASVKIGELWSAGCRQNRQLSQKGFVIFELCR